MALRAGDAGGVALVSSLGKLLACRLSSFSDLFLPFDSRLFREYDFFAAGRVSLSSSVTNFII